MQKLGEQVWWLKENKRRVKFLGDGNESFNFQRIVAVVYKAVVREVGRRKEEKKKEEGNF
jgi:hypothetical protein